MGFKMTFEGALTLLDSQAREYRIAYAMGNGEWDVVDKFLAVNDAGANAYAETYYAGQEWYVLDRYGRNINGGRDQA